MADLPCSLREGLESYGLSDPEVLASSFAVDEPMEAYDRLALQLGEESEGSGALLRDLVAACRRRSKRIPSRLAAVTDTEILVWTEKRAKTSPSVQPQAVMGRTMMTPPAGKAPQARWPTKLEKRLAAATSAPAKETV